jgi:hypothetical protein
MVTRKSLRANLSRDDVFDAPSSGIWDGTKRPLPRGDHADEQNNQSHEPSIHCHCVLSSRASYLVLFPLDRPTTAGDRESWIGFDTRSPDPAVDPVGVDGLRLCKFGEYDGEWGCDVQLTSFPNVRGDRVFASVS